MSQKENRIKMLNAIEFHDLPVKGLHIKAERGVEITVDYYLYVEDKEDYDSYSMVFSSIKSADLQKFPLKTETDMEITEFDYNLINDEFHCELLFLLGFGQPSLELKIICGDIQIIKNDFDVEK